LKRATEHVVGPQAAMVAISIGPEDDRSARTTEICDAADAVDAGDGVVVVTDMYGGSPSNLSLRACRPSNRRILTGVNLPMMVKLAKSRNLPVEEAVARAEEAGDAISIPSREDRNERRCRGDPHLRDRERQGPARPRRRPLRRSGRGA
jgi:PTS system mannose-specific IIA component